MFWFSPRSDLMIGAPLVYQVHPSAASCSWRCGPLRGSCTSGRRRWPICGARTSSTVRAEGRSRPFRPRRSPGARRPHASAADAPTRRGRRGPVAACRGTFVTTAPLSGRGGLLIGPAVGGP
nr:respiratory nitrate reductase subunit gamma [Microbispora rosea]